jgi:hypothetical protein
MSTATQRPVFTHKAAKELLKTARNYSQPQQQWRADNRLRYALTSNLTLMRELYKMSNQNPYPVRGLLNDCEKYVLQAATALRQPQQLLNLPPNHPSIINNINHPLNPSNPNNLMLNPAMNLLFQQDEATQASILENEIEESAENATATQTVVNEVLATDNLQRVAEATLANNPEINPHKALGLSADASNEQVEAACLSALAETAPQPGEKPSHEFGKAAAASMILSSGHGHGHEHEHGLHTAPQPIAAKS